MAIFLQADVASADLMRVAISTSVTFVESPVQLRSAVATDASCDLVVIGPDVDTEIATDFASSMRLARPSMGVVLIRRRLDTSVMAQALRAGVREVVPSENLTALSDACRRSEEISSQVRGLSSPESEQTSQGVGQLVTVFSAKGGCGKTTVATNLAAILASGGSRRVCLVDLDLAFGDVAIAMQLFPARTIADAVGLSRLDEPAVRSLLTTHSPGLDALVAPVEPGTADSIPGPLVANLLQVLKSMFDYVVIDTPPAFTDHVLAAFDHSDHVLLLATLDIPALKNLKLTLETLEMLNYPRDRWHIVLNRSDSKVGLSIADVEKTLKTQIDCQLPSSRAVPSSINRGVPIVIDEPSHPVSTALRRFAEAKLIVRIAVPASRRIDRRGFHLLRRGKNNV